MKRLSLFLLLLTVPMCGAGPRDDLPPFPAFLPTAFGPIPVTRVGNLMCNTQRAYGCFHYRPPRIEIDSALDEVSAWATIYHEAFHATMFVEGITFEDPTAENRLADAVGKQRILELRAGWPK